MMYTMANETWSNGNKKIESHIFTKKEIDDNKFTKKVTQNWRIDELLTDKTLTTYKAPTPLKTHKDIQSTLERIGVNVKTVIVTDEFMPDGESIIDTTITPIS